VRRPGFDFFPLVSALPLTPAGWFGAGLSIALMIGRPWTGNHFRVAGIAIFLTLAAVLAAAFIQARRLSVLNPDWIADGEFRAGGKGRSQLDVPTAFRPLPFFRVIARLSVTAATAGSRFGIYREAVADSDTMEIFSPLCGQGTGALAYSVGDVLGLVRVRAWLSDPRMITILPPATGMEQPVIDLSAGGAQEQEKRTSAEDETRYYMREYAPGDRIRDINWKASERLEKLITRIPPRTQEDAPVVVLIAPGFAGHRIPRTRDSLMALTWAKGLLWGFALQLFRTRGDTRIELLLPGGVISIRNADELFAAAGTLAESGWGPGMVENSQTNRQIFWFPTPFDSGPENLPMGDRLMVIPVSIAAPDAKSKTAGFLAPDMSVIPGLYAFRRGPTPRKGFSGIRQPAGLPLRFTLFADGGQS